MSVHSHQGVSIILAGTQTSGLYVSGQPYIVISGPTNLTAISNPPNQDYGACTADGGAMKNPIPMGTQGFCSHYVGTDSGVYVHAYEASKNIQLSLPYSVSPGDSITVSIMRDDLPSTKVPVYKIVVFMFVSEAPPAGSFRPGFYGTDRSLAFNESDIQWDRIANYPRAGLTTCPTQTYMEDEVRFPPLPWHEWGADWTATKVRPQYNTANTNAENTAQFSAQRFGDAAMWINLDWTQAQKRKIVIRLIQNGIDMCSYHMAGGQMLASGSHQTGWKFPAFLAAVLLQDPDMLAITRNHHNFVEGSLTTYRISLSDLSRYYTLDGTNYPFLYEDVGTYWWGIQHYSQSDKDRQPTIPTADPYQGIYGLIVPSLLAVRMMQAESDWGWGIAFRYMPRHLSIFGIGTGFFSEVYNLVNPTLPAIETVTVPLPATPQALVQEASFSATLSNQWGHPMRYNTNGSTPTSSSTLYSAPFTVASTTTVKTLCFPTDGQDAGSVATIAYTIISNGTPAPPTNVTLSS